MSREERVATTFVELADTLVATFDALDFMHLLTERAVELLDADAAGLIMADQRGYMQVMASTNYEARVLEVFQIQSSEGPCLECYHTGEPIVNLDIEEVAHRWPNFGALAKEAGFRATHAIPMRLRDETIGALNLYCNQKVELTEMDVALGRAMADIATIGLLQERAIKEHELLSEQLQSALNSRVLVEQAKGVLAERASLGIDEAFESMRSYSRRTRTPLTDVARAVIADTLDAATLRE